MALPSGYKQLEYIQSHGSQYIDTGLYATRNTKVVAEAELLSDTVGDFPMLCGAYTNGTSQFAVFYYSGKWQAWFGGWASSFAGNYTGLNTFLLDNTTFSVSENSIPVSCNSFTTTRHTIAIFAINQDPTLYYHSSIKLYYMKFYESGVLVRDYVPAKRTSDNVIGLYDLVTGVFYTNKGSGAFTAGPEVSTLVHKVLANATIYPTDRGKVMVDETIYWLTKGKTLKDETIYEIPFVRPEGEPDEPDEPDIPVDPGQTITVTMTGSLGTSSLGSSSVIVNGVTYTSINTITAPYGAEITVKHTDYAGEHRVNINGTVYNKDMTFLAYSDVTVNVVLSAFVTVDDYEIV